MQKHDLIRQERTSSFITWKILHQSQMKVNDGITLKPASLSGLQVLPDIFQLHGWFRGSLKASVPLITAKRSVPYPYQYRVQFGLRKQQFSNCDAIMFQISRDRQPSSKQTKTDISGSCFHGQRRFNNPGPAPICEVVIDQVTWIHLSDPMVKELYVRIRLQSLSLGKLNVPGFVKAQVGVIVYHGSNSDREVLNISNMVWWRKL